MAEAREGDRPRPVGESEAPDSDLEWMVEDLANCGRAVIERVSERAKHNIQLIRDREYDFNAWLDDIRWFWSGVADDAQQALGTVQRRTRDG